MIRFHDLIKPLQWAIKFAAIAVAVFVWLEVATWHTGCTLAQQTAAKQAAAVAGKSAVSLAQQMIYGAVGGAVSSAMTGNVSAASLEGSAAVGAIQGLVVGIRGIQGTPQAANTAALNTAVQDYSSSETVADQIAPAVTKTVAFLVQNNVPPSVANETVAQAIDYATGKASAAIAANLPK